MQTFKICACNQKLPLHALAQAAHMACCAFHKGGVRFFDNAFVCSHGHKHTAMLFATSCNARLIGVNR